MKQNPRYATVGSVINSGTTVHKVRSVSTTEFLKRRNELFRRVSGSMLRELFDEYEPAGHEDAFHLTPRKLGDGIGSLTASPSPAPRVVVHAADDTEEAVALPMLLLDVRDVASHAAFHIRRARSFPLQNLHQDRISAELHAYKNKADTLIVLYEDAERDAVLAATHLAEKGYDNVFVLTGGLRAFASRHVDYCNGQLPDSVVASSACSPPAPRSTPQRSARTRTPTKTPGGVSSHTRQRAASARQSPARTPAHGLVTPTRTRTPARIHGAGAHTLSPPPRPPPAQSTPLPPVATGTRPDPASHQPQSPARTPSPGGTRPVPDPREGGCVPGGPRKPLASKPGVGANCSAGAAAVLTRAALEQHQDRRRMPTPDRRWRGRRAAPFATDGVAETDAMSAVASSCCSSVAASVIERSNARKARAMR